MLRRERTVVSGICSIVALAALAMPAAAADPTGNDVADAFLKTLEATGASDVTVESVSGDGGTTTITGLSATRKTGDQTSMLTVAEVDIAGGSVGADGALSADSIAANGLAMEQADEEATVTVAEMEADQVKLPAPDAISSGEQMGSTASYRSMKVAGVNIEQPGKEPITIADISVEITERENGQPRAGGFSVSGIKVPVGALEQDDEGAQQLKDLGYDAIGLDIVGKGGWDAATGAATLEEFRLDADDMGELTLKAKLGGITPQVLASLQQEDQGFEQLMGALGTVTVDSLSIGYNDDGLTDKILEKAASDQGVDKATLVAQLSQMMPMMLAMLENPEFEKKVTDAVTTFLNAPGNLTVSADPPAPVAVPQLVGVAMMAPQTIPTVLSVDIKANQ